MDYKIISDTSCDLTEQMRDEYRVSYVPFKITVEDKEFIDNDDIDIQELLLDMGRSETGVRTACPAPYDYLQELEKVDEDNVFILTISKKLSASYNSAVIAAKEYKQKNPKKNVYVVDSQSASAGQTSVFFKMIGILENEDNFDLAVEKIEDAVKDNFTFFVLESLDNLIKNGRIGKVSGLLANVLNVRPIMKGKEGEITLYEMNRGFKRALSKLAEALGKVCDDLEDRVLFISHVDGLEKADQFKKKVKELYNFKDIVIIKTKGLSTCYADNGGIVIGF
jgi:DegV family protein with EDD domain